MADRKRLRVGWRDTDLARRQSLLPLILQQHPAFEYVLQAPFALARFFPGTPAHGDPQPKLGHQPLCLSDIGFNLLKNTLWHEPNNRYRSN